MGAAFPFLFGGTFIEGLFELRFVGRVGDFPSFSEGLSLRELPVTLEDTSDTDFPSFSEGLSLRV